jgi:hypothetical protein
LTSDSFSLNVSDADCDLLVIMTNSYESKYIIFALGVFLDVGEAFDNTFFGANHEVHFAISRYINCSSGGYTDVATSWYLNSRRGKTGDIWTELFWRIYSSKTWLFGGFRKDD